MHSAVSVMLTVASSSFSCVSTGAQCPVRLSSCGGGGDQVMVMVKNAQFSGDQPADGHSVYSGNAASSGGGGGGAYFPFGHCGRPRNDHRLSKIPPMIRPQFEEIF